jgi:ATP-binding cassette, subfamily B, multidrug efflux pump
MFSLSRFLRPFALLLAGVLVLQFGQAMAQLYLPTLLADIVDQGIVKGDIDYIWQIGMYMLLVAGVGAICSVLAALLASRVSTGFGRNLRSAVFSQVSSFSLHEFDTLGTATLITRTTNDINQVQQVWQLIMMMMITAPITAVGGVIMAVSKDATLSLIFVVAIPILAATITLIALRAVPLFRAMQKKIDRLNLVLRENLTGIRVIRAFNRTEYEKARFTEANADLTATAIQVNRTMALLFPILLLVMNFTTIAILWFGGLRIDSGGMQVGSLIAFLQYAMQIMWSLLMVSMLFIMVPRAQASSTRINEVLNLAPEITDPAPAQMPSGRRGLVEFRNVTFSYPGAEQPALCDISFTARPGEVVAIIGGTGAGKSTLVNLIPRFYDVDSGSILLEGVSVSEMLQETLRARIGFVPQQAVLFTGTVADNIRYGKEDATDDEVRRAADVAQATDFITAMPEGFDAPIAQGGANVSGGQKQRLAIARALVRRPAVYIFDDSFSALDFKTDARLRRALRRETTQSTVIIVGQRVATIMDADRILVLDEGRLAAQGTHRELLQSSEIYREIVASQLSEEELAA